MCCIEYTPTVWDVFSGSITYNAIAQTIGATCSAPGTITQINTGNKCAGAELCWQNYVIIPGALSQGVTIPQAAITFIPIHAQNGNDR